MSTLRDLHPGFHSGRVTEFMADHPELVAEKPSDQLALFPESQAGHRQQPYEMSPEEFVHGPGAWFHANTNPLDTNRQRTTAPEWSDTIHHQGTHIGSLKAAAERSLSLTHLDQGEPMIHPVRIKEGVLPTSTPDELSSEYAKPQKTVTRPGRRGPHGLWEDQGSAEKWDAASDAANNRVPPANRTRGLLYINNVEDSGSISATVPHGTATTALDWVKQGMAEHPERVHPGLQHWATGGSTAMTFDHAFYSAHHYGDGPDPVHESPGQMVLEGMPSKRTRGEAFTSPSARGATFREAMRSCVTGH